MFASATSSRFGRRYSYYAVTFIAVAVVFLVAQWHRTSQGRIRSIDHSKWHMLERSQRYTRLVGGTDGFYTFDNVFVKNQVIRESYRVHHRLITFPSTFPCLNPDMASCPSWLAFRPGTEPKPTGISGPRNDHNVPSELASELDPRALSLPQSSCKSERWTVPRTATTESIDDRRGGSRYTRME
jgi:hypothetical protein